MKQLTNYKLIDFFNQSEEIIEEYMPFLKHVETYTKRKLVTLKFIEVENIKQKFNSNNDIDIIECVGIIQEMRNEYVLEMSVFDFFGLVNNLKKQLQQIIEAENNMANSAIPNIKYEIVNGAERMAKFGVYNILETLSNNDVTKYDHVLNMQYSEVFTILLMRKEKNDIELEMQKLKNN